MDGSPEDVKEEEEEASAPRVHGWFHSLPQSTEDNQVCPACAWMVPFVFSHDGGVQGLPRVCMDGSAFLDIRFCHRVSAPRVHGWFR